MAGVAVGVVGQGSLEGVLLLLGGEGDVQGSALAGGLERLLETQLTHLLGEQRLNLAINLLLSAVLFIEIDI